MKKEKTAKAHLKRKLKLDRRSPPPVALRTVNRG
jgi:hypothetical protein